jgi:hypothetical protein
MAMLILLGKAHHTLDAAFAPPPPPHERTAWTEQQKLNTLAADLHAPLLAVLCDSVRIRFVFLLVMFAGLQEEFRRGVEEGAEAESQPLRPRWGGATYCLG